MAEYSANMNEDDPFSDWRARQKRYLAGDRTGLSPRELQEQQEFSKAGPDGQRVAKDFGEGASQFGSNFVRDLTSLFGMGNNNAASRVPRDPPFVEASNFPEQEYLEGLDLTGELQQAPAPAVAPAVAPAALANATPPRKPPAPASAPPPPPPPPAASEEDYWGLQGKPPPNSENIPPQFQYWKPRPNLFDMIGAWLSRSNRPDPNEDEDMPLYDY